MQWSNLLIAFHLDYFWDGWQQGLINLYTDQLVMKGTKMVLLAFSWEQRFAKER